MRVGLAAASGSVNIEQGSRSKSLVSSFGVRTSYFASELECCEEYSRTKDAFPRDDLKFASQ